MVAGGRDVTAMRRPTIRLGYVLELVATAAVCFAVVRSQMTSRNVGLNFIPVGDSGYIRLNGGAILTGLALAGGVGLAVETSRGRRPSSWGLGRWIWSIAGVYVIFSVASQLAALTINRLVRENRLPPLGVAVRGVLERAAIYEFFGGFAWAIAAVCVTSMLAGMPPRPDSGRPREGRTVLRQRGRRPEHRRDAPPGGGSVMASPVGWAPPTVFGPGRRAEPTLRDCLQSSVPFSRYHILSSPRTSRSETR